MTEPLEKALPRTARALDESRRRGDHLGGQIYVSQGGGVVADSGFGEARPGEPMQRDHLALWLSSTKPITAVAIAQLWQEGRLELDEAVARHLPEFAAHGKQAITLRHLLTHTGGIRMLDVGWPERSWEEIVAGIAARRPEPRWVPGEKAGYHQASSWFVLGEIVRRLAGGSFSRVIRERVFLPAGMTDCWIGMPRERFAAERQRLAPMFETDSGSPRPCGWETEARVTRPAPGGNGYGPIRELGRFYEILLARGRTPDGGRLLTSQTVEALTAPHRVGMFDHTFRRTLDWGLGFIVNSWRYGGEEIPYGYGPHASRRTFGHSGYRSSTGFADPRHTLAVGLFFNGMPDDAAHERRIREATAAIYEDLGLAPKGEAGGDESPRRASR